MRASPPATPKATLSVSPSQPRSMARLIKKATPRISATTPIRASQLPPTSHSQFQLAKSTDWKEGSPVPPSLGWPASSAGRSRPLWRCPGPTACPACLVAAGASSAAAADGGEGRPSGCGASVASAWGCRGAGAPGRPLSRAPRRSDNQASSAVMELIVARRSRSSESLGVPASAAGAADDPDSTPSRWPGSGVPHHGQNRSLADTSRSQLRQVM